MTTTLGRYFTIDAETIIDFAMECASSSPGRWYAFLDAWSSCLLFSGERDELKKVVDIVEDSMDVAFPRSVSPSTQAGQLLYGFVDRARNGVLLAGRWNSTDPTGTSESRAVPFVKRTWETDLSLPRTTMAGGPRLLEMLTPFFRAGTHVRIVDPYFATHSLETQAADTLLGAVGAPKHLEVWTLENPSGGRCRQGAALLGTLKNVLALKAGTHLFHDRMIMVSSGMKIEDRSGGGVAIALGRGVGSFIDGNHVVVTNLPWQLAVDYCERVKGSRFPLPPPA